MELRKECYACGYKDKCLGGASYDSVYCTFHRFYDTDKLEEKDIDRDDKPNMKTLIEIFNDIAKRKIRRDKIKLRWEHGGCYTLFVDDAAWKLIHDNGTSLVMKKVLNNKFEIIK